MELPRHRPNPTRPPTIWICGPRAYTLCTFLIKRYCNCGLTSKHHGLHYRQPPLRPCFPLRSSLSVVPTGRPSPLSSATLIRSFIRVLSFVHYRVRIKLPTCNRRYPPRGSPLGGWERKKAIDSAGYSHMVTGVTKTMHSISNWFNIGKWKRNCKLLLYIYTTL